MDLLMRRKRVTKTKRERAEDFLRKRKRILNITGFEKETLIPVGTIQKFLNYDRKISNERITKIDKMLLECFIDYKDD